MTEGSHFQLAGLEVQLADTVSRKVVKVQEPIGKGPALGEELEEGEAGAALLRGLVSFTWNLSSLFLVVVDLPVVVVAILLMQTNGKSDDQGDQAGDGNGRHDEESPPSASGRNVFVNPQILELLSLGTPDVPECV